MPVDLPPPVLEAVVVTAARLPPLPGDAAYSVIRLDAAEIIGRRRTDEALKTVPGVSLFRRSGSGAANATTQGLSLRAIAPSGAGRALITLDGVPLNDPFGGWTIWAQVPPETLEGAYVIRGAGAGPYGAGALTGVVAVEEMARPEAMAAEIAGGSMGTARASGAAVFPAGSATLFTALSAETSDGWIPVREGRGAADAPLAYDSWSAAARFQATLGPGDLAVRAGAYEESKGAGLVGADSRASGQVLSATLAAQPTEEFKGWRIQGWVRRSDLVNRSVAVAPGRAFTTPANEQYETPALGYGFNAAVRSVGAAWTWEAGADLRAAEGASHERFRNLGAGFTRDRRAGGEMLVGGGYGEASWTSGPWLVTGGARLDYWNTGGGFRTERDLATGLVTFQDHPDGRDGVTPSARAAARRNLTGGLAVRAAAYSGFRPPTLNELHRPFRVGNDITESNAALAPEHLYGVEGGVSGEAAGFGWAATLFLNRLDDAVTNVTIGAGPGIFPEFPGAGFVPDGGVLRQRRNAGRIDAMGVEAEARRDIGERATLRAAVAWTRAKIDGGATAPQLTGLRPAQAPELTVTAGLDWRALDRLTLAADLRYEGARFEDDLNSRELDPATVLDLRADWRISDGLSAYAAVANAFDAAVQTSETADGIAGYDAPRTFRVGITLRR